MEKKLCPFCPSPAAGEADSQKSAHLRESGEGNGNPLQYSCLENPVDGEAWWAAVYGVAQSDTTEVTSQQQQQQGVKTETFPLIEPVVASGVVARA